MENQYGRIQVSYFIIIILTLISPGGQISAVDCAIAAKICIKVECYVNYKTVFLDYSLLSFTLYEVIMLIYAKNHYKSLIKASRLLIVGTYILFLTSLAIVL